MYVVIQGRESVGYKDAFAFKKQLSQVIILSYEHFFFVTSLSSFNQSFFTFLRTKLITCILLHFIALAFSPIIINSFKVQTTYYRLLCLCVCPYVKVTVNQLSKFAHNLQKVFGPFILNYFKSENKEGQKARPGGPTVLVILEMIFAARGENPTQIQSLCQETTKSIIRDTLKCMSQS